MENKGVNCYVCECVHNTAGCGCDRSVIEVTNDSHAQISKFRTRISARATKRNKHAN